MKNRIQSTSAIGVAVAAFCLLGDHRFQSPASGQEPQGRKQAESNQDDFAEKDSASLGVLVGACPGGGVCVIDTMNGGPAESAGIQAGDYILGINDQDVTSPNELKQKVEALEPIDTVNINIWRRGEKLTKEVVLASKGEQLPRSQRSFLGVVLSASEQQAGVTIQSVQDNSPAERAGLQSGDRVTLINGKEVDTIEQFVETVQDYEPGAELELKIRRDEQEMDRSVVLGEIGSAPMHWFRQSFQRSIDDDASMPMSPGLGMMDEVIDDMREQIRLLQEQVNELKRPGPPPVSRSLEGADESPAEQPIDDDFSSTGDFSSRFSTLVQYDGRQGFRPNISNDWTGSRYGSQGYLDRNNAFQGRYRSYYGNRGYNSYPYNYYRNGGRPYYYGGRSPYGYRGGVRIGPNFSIWW